MPAELVVPDDASQQAIVGGRDPVVIIQVQLRKGGHVDLVLPAPVNRRGELVVEPVNALEDDDRPVGQIQRNPLVAPVAGVEVEARYQYPLSGHEPQQVIVQQLDVDGLQTLEVVAAVGVQGGQLPGDKVVVQCDRDGVPAQDLQLNRQLLGEGRFSRGRRTGDQHQPDLVAPVVQTVGDLGDLLVVQGLDHLNEAPDVSPGDQVVHVPDTGYIQDLAPVLVFPIDGEQNRVLLEIAQALGTVPWRIAKDESGGMVLDVEDPEHRAPGHKGGMGQVHELPAREHGDLHVVAVLQEQHRIGVVVVFEVAHRFAVRDRAAANRQIRDDELPHAGRQSLEVRRGDFPEAIEVVEVRPAQGMADDQATLGKQLPGGDREQEAQGAPIDRSPFPRGQQHGLHRAVDLDPVGKAREGLVHPGAHDRGQPLELPVFEHRLGPDPGRKGSLSAARKADADRLELLVHEIRAYARPRVSIS